MKTIKLLTAFIILLALSACAYKQVTQVKKNYVDDFVIFSQDPLFYANLFNPDSLLISAERQKEFYANFRRRFFRVWTDSLNLDAVLRYHQSELVKYTRRPGIGENKLRRDSSFGEEIQARANLEGGFNTLKRGIMLNYSYIRAVPTIKPFFRDFAIAGEGYPFDYFQLSTIPIGTPIFIYHENDNWALIDSHICNGWVPRNHIAFLEDEVIETIMASQLIAITKDKTPIYNARNRYIGHADIGTVFAKANESCEYFKAVFVHENEMNYGELTHILVPKTVAEEIPIPLTMHNIARICAEMMNQVYGWGGLYFNRDCSQSLLDLYKVFGILLPRNGRQQAYNFGRFHDMRPAQRPEFVIPNHEDKKQRIARIEAKKAEIISKAIPFLTLVRTPGHIMLYVGHVDGEPLVFHTIWGLRTLDAENRDGRHIIGRTVITSLEPGKNLYNINPNMTLINRLEGITFFE